MPPLFYYRLATAFGFKFANGNLVAVSFNAFTGFGISQPSLITTLNATISSCAKLYSISPDDGSCITASVNTLYVTSCLIAYTACEKSPAINIDFVLSHAPLSKNAFGKLSISVPLIVLLYQLAF